METPRRRRESCVPLDQEVQPHSLDEGRCPPLLDVNHSMLREEGRDRLVPKRFLPQMTGRSHCCWIEDSIDGAYHRRVLPRRLSGEDDADEEEDDDDLNVVVDE
jgi:hypothetical protein